MRPTHACQLCGDQYPARYLFDLKGDAEFPGGAKVTCLKCWGRLQEREACAKVAHDKARFDLRRAECPILWPTIDAYEEQAAQIAAAIRARSNPANLRDSASKPDDVDRPADHFGDLGGEA